MLIANYSDMGEGVYFNAPSIAPTVAQPPPMEIPANIIRPAVMPVSTVVPRDLAMTTANPKETVGAGDSTGPGPVRGQTGATATSSGGFNVWHAVLGAIVGFLVVKALGGRG